MFGDLPDECWDYLILDGDAPTDDLGSCAVGDVDGDGHVEILTGGKGKLLWYRPDTFERGVVAEGHFHVGLVLEDVDDDGAPEIVAGVEGQIIWLKSAGGMDGPWERHVIEPQTRGSAHDLVFCDIDNDGVNELVALAAYSPTSGVFIYKHDGDPTRTWSRHTVQQGHFAEGTCVADLDGDGQLEIISGPAWYHAPADGPLSGAWERHEYALGFREMCRTAPLDVTGSGRPDIVAVESEYPDGHLSWFENRLPEGEGFVEHPLERDLTFAHSIHAWRKEGKAHFFIAEMAKGGWGALYNLDARLLQFTTADGATWDRKVLCKGAGTHEAIPFDVDGDGVWEIAGKEWHHTKPHLYKRRAEPSPLARFRHHLIDRDKPYTATDILAVDVDGDGRNDIACGGWWYRNPGWERRDIPGIFQVHTACDIDGDGREEIVATKRAAEEGEWYEGLCSELVWLKPVDPLNGEWEEHPIGTGTADWPHGSLVAPVLPDDRLALIIGYHNAGQGNPPDIFEVPADPADGPWPMRRLADINYGEEFVACDVDGDGRPDLVAGPWWLRNEGDGNFTPYPIAEGFDVARVRVFDVNGDGRPDVVLGEEVLDKEDGWTAFSRLAWFENPDDPTDGPWKAHVIDKVRCPHSVGAADLDGDGRMEVICGEHDPSRPYRNRSRLFIYKQADDAGTAWYRYEIDHRFEHHDGAKVIELAPGRLGIMSHGWRDTFYVHLWEPCPDS